MSQLHYHYTPFRGKKSSSRPSVDIFKASYIQCRRSLLHFSLSSSGLTISASTLLRNLYISKKIPSQCRYQVDDVSLVDGVFDGAFGGDGEEDVVMGEGVIVTSSSLEMLTKSCLGGTMVSLIFLEGLAEEA
ncbi:hypothetical protein Tco_1164339 [Tanacetum coccineum]